MIARKSIVTILITMEKSLVKWAPGLGGDQPYVPPALYSPGLIFPGPMFPGTYVPPS